MMGGTPVAFVWENLGPSHDDRLRALHRARVDVLAVQLFNSSMTYEWEKADQRDYEVVTLASRGTEIGSFRLAWRLYHTIRKCHAKHVFMCDYNRLSVVIVAWILKLSGRRVYAMLDSKFDDYPRHWPMTIAKVVALSPYWGALVAAERSRDYVTYMGVPRERVALGVDSLDIQRLRQQSGSGVLPAFQDRPFLAVARLVPKKNLSAAISAFARYRLEHGGQRRFLIAGYGPLEPMLRDQVASFGIVEAVEFLGSLTSAEVTTQMRDALALVLPSTEEQFGLVAIEAFAMGLPVIISRNAGATDQVVSNLVNGFVINPLDDEQLLNAMLLLDCDEQLHARMAEAAFTAGERGDVRHFVAGVKQLLGS